MTYLTKTLLVVAGPTAVGKTAISIQLAKYFDTVILSCDSRQFFREMNIGTAKPDVDELQVVPHYFINSHSIFDNYSVGDFEQDALKLLSQLFENQSIVIMAGGSGLYIKAVCEGLDQFPAVDKKIREQIVEKYEQEGIAYLQNTLQQLDPVYFTQVDTQNPQRMIRALEICLSTGQPFSSFRQQKKVNRPFQIVKIGLTMEREQLYERINKRVEKMMGAGLLEEVKKLYPHKKLNPLQTVGYQELFNYLDGHISLEEAVALIQRNTRRYAKRQYTWFRKDKDIHWFEVNDYNSIIDFLAQKFPTI